MKNIMYTYKMMRNGDKLIVNSSLFASYIHASDAIVCAHYGRPVTLSVICMIIPIIAVVMMFNMREKT